MHHMHKEMKHQKYNVTHFHIDIDRPMISHHVPSTAYEYNRRNSGQTLHHNYAWIIVINLYLQIDLGHIYINITC